jgi:CRP/FNR family transcriptional regulator, anaerobic regulatory protein
MERNRSGGGKQMPQGGWVDRFPSLANLDADRRAQLESGSRIVQLPSGSRVFGVGQMPENFLLLIDGRIRVQQVSETGREIVLYRVIAGESCPLTTSCLMGHEGYSAEAIAESDIRGVAIPRPLFDDLLAGSGEFRRFVFDAFSRRITNLFRLVEDVAFARIDIRLALKLLELSGNGDVLAVTHQQLAAELGTAREVISRQLNEFQRRGWVSAVRGSVTIADRAALQRLGAEGSAAW